MFPSATEPSSPVIDHEFGASHTYFHNRAPTSARVARSPSPPPEAVLQESGVTTWMTKLSESSYAYHSRGRASRPVIRQWPADTAPTEFVPSAQWHTQTESSISFHATGTRKAPAQEQREASTSSFEIQTDRTESSICFHCRSAQ